MRVFLLSIAFAFSFLVAVPSASNADSRAQIVKDLKKGTDFRVRVASALKLGNMKDVTSVPALEGALSDEHPAVRAAVAAALAKIGVPTSAAALKRAAAVEKNTSVKRQMEKSAQALEPAAVAAPPKFIVQIGALTNRSAVNSPATSRAFKTATETYVKKVPGALVTSGGTTAAHKDLPVLAIDGTLRRLESSRSGNELAYAANVEYIIKVMPQSALKGSMSGSAQAMADARSVRTRSDHEELQVDAVSAAVESAMKRAPLALAEASK